MQKQANCTKGEVGEKKNRSIYRRKPFKTKFVEKKTHTYTQGKIESLHRRVRSVSML